MIRAGYSVNFYSEGMLSFTNLGGNNPGSTQRANLTPDVNFPAGSLAVGDPLPAFNFFPPSFSFPLALSNFAFTNQTVGSIDPEIRAPYVQTWSLGIQREVRPGAVLEVRYAGNHGVNLWHAYSINEVNIFENGFLDQFVAAQNNLNINQAAGVSSFANAGLAGQKPVPIFETAFTGLAPSQGFGNPSFINLLRTGQAGAMANSMAQSSRYFCNMVGSSFAPCAKTDGAPGPYPVNFFQINPYVATANLLSSNSFSNYNGLQIEFRQSLSHGLTFNANYAWAHALTDRYNKNVDNLGNFTTLRNRSLDRGPSPWDIRHVFQAFGTYELPFGRGRHFNITSRALDAVAGGWTIGSVFRMQTGLPFKLSSGQLTVNQQDSGVVSSVSAGKLQSAVGVFTPAGKPDVFFLDPELVGADGKANPAFLSLPTTPGQFASFIYLYGPKFVTSDVSIAKRMPIIGERLRAEFRAEMLNAFNHPIFQVPTGGTFSVNPVSINATTFGRTTTTTTLPRQVQFRLLLAF